MERGGKEEHSRPREQPVARSQGGRAPGVSEDSEEASAAGLPEAVQGRGGRDERRGDGRRPGGLAGHCQRQGAQTPPWAAPFRPTGPHCAPCPSTSPASLPARHAPSGSQAALLDGRRAVTFHRRGGHPPQRELLLHVSRGRIRPNPRRKRWKRGSVWPNETGPPVANSRARARPHRLPRPRPHHLPRPPESV